MAASPIVNAHHHIGDVHQAQDAVFEWDDTVEQLIAAMDEHHVDASILMPLGGANGPGVRSVHDQIYAATREYPGRLFGVAAPNPHLGHEFVHDEMERVVTDYDFKYAKLHTLAWGVDPTSAVAYDFFDACRANDLPVMVHTGPHGMPFSVPGMLMPVAEDYPDLPIVLAHMGGAYTLTQEAILMAERYDNLYLDTTLALNLYVRRALDRVGADRLLMAAEHSSNLPVALAKIRSIGASPEQERRILGGNAIDLYDLDVANQEFSDQPTPAAR